MSAGVKVIDKGWKQIERQLKKMVGASVKVGYPEEKQRSHGPNKGAGEGKAKGKPLDMAYLATIHEMGLGVPPRPFMAQTFDTNKEKVNQFIAESQAAIYDGKLNTLTALRRLGAFYKGLMQKTFVTGKFTALKAQTVKRKKSSRPLVDTGQLRQSIDFEVVAGKKK